VHSWWQTLIGVAAALLVVWLTLILLLWRAKPDDMSVRAAARLLPDTLRLVRRLGTDRSLPITVRLLIWILIGYLLLPIDVIPDFVPVLGYADDVVAVMLVLRLVVRRAGPEALARHWPGTPDGLAVVSRLAGIAEAD
jgi:uncharacterized membrane protein YkvA (DUF1232 family)